MHITECTTCHTQFRDSDDTAGVCPNGHENTWADDDEYPVGSVTI